jgi:hypothetical protein
MALQSITWHQEGVHRLVRGATHAIEPHCATLAASRIRAMPWRVAGVRALPARRIAACMGAHNRRIWAEFN